MRRQIRRLLSLIITLSFIFAGQTTQTAAVQKTSAAIFDWKEDYSHLSRDYNSIAYGKGLFVAVGEKGIICVSKDLKKWDNVEVSYSQSYESDSNWGFKTVLFNGQNFVTAGGRNIFYSKDGYHWDSVKVMEYNDKSSNALVISPDEGISYGTTNGRTFVLSGFGVLLYSTDGKNWAKHPNAHKRFGAGGGEGTIFSNVIYDGKKYISICLYVNEDTGNKNYVYTSEDGITWDITEYKGPTCSFRGEFLTYNGSKYYISCKQNEYYESDDLKNWKSTETELRSEFYHINNAAYELGNGIYSFESGKEILQYQAGSNQTINSMCSGNGQIVAVGTDGLILVSDTSSKKMYGRNHQTDSFLRIFTLPLPVRPVLWLWVKTVKLLKALMEPSGRL